MPTRAADVYAGSDAVATRKYLRQLEQVGEQGLIAAALFRAQKASCRAKQYRGRYIDHAYRRKGEAIEELCHYLAYQTTITWGWGEDKENQYAPWVLYVDLPGQGQVSFHSVDRGDGPSYGARWDGRTLSEKRILRFCDSVFGIHYEVSVLER